MATCVALNPHAKYHGVPQALLVPSTHTLPSPGTLECILLILSYLCFQSTLSGSAAALTLNQRACHECPCRLSLQSRVSLDSCARPSTKPLKLLDEACHLHHLQSTFTPTSLCLFQQARWTGGEATNCTGQEKAASGMPKCLHIQLRAWQSQEGVEPQPASTIPTSSAAHTC